jgi:hypothetical protein
MTIWSRLIACDEADEARENADSHSHLLSTSMKYESEIYYPPFHITTGILLYN